MASTRKIVYASVASPGAPQTIYSSATTRAELYAQYPEMELQSKGMKAWVKKAGDPTDKGYGLENPGSHLPDEDLIIYFLVDKNDSGN